MRVGICAALTSMLVTTLVSRPAHADKMDERLDIALRLSGGWANVDSLSLHPAPLDEAPDLVEAGDLHLTGRGPAFSGTLRGNLHLNGFRVGAGVGYAAIDGLALHHMPLAGGATLHADRVWGMPFELFAGYAFPFWDEVQPYAEARGSLTILQTRIEAIHPELGSLGTTAFNGYAPGIGMTVGVLVDIHEYFFFDAGGSVDLIGPMRLSMHAALGIPIPLANL